MGFSARYHAASLAAVFFALAIGILIGSQIGGDILDRTRKDLEASLTTDLDRTRDQVNGLQAELDSANEFGNRVVPPLTALQLRGDRLGLIGFGSLPAAITEAVEQAIQPTSAKLAAAGVVRQPPDLDSLADSLQATRFGRINGIPGQLTPYGRTVGRQLVDGGRVLNLSRSALMSRSSGQFGELDGLVIYHGDQSDLQPEDADLSQQLNHAIVEGVQGTRARLVGVEEVPTDPSSVAWFSDLGVSSVDNIDLPAGRVSLVYVLAGAAGNFGIKDDSDQLMPDLLRPAPGPGTAGSTAGKQG